jgi:hypothetical protein
MTSVGRIKVKASFGTPLKGIGNPERNICDYPKCRYPPARTLQLPATHFFKGGQYPLTSTKFISWLTLTLERYVH